MDHASLLCGVEVMDDFLSKRKRSLSPTLVVLALTFAEC